MFDEIFAIHSENHIIGINILCGWSVEMLMRKKVMGFMCGDDCASRFYQSLQQKLPQLVPETFISEGLLQK